MTVYPTTRLWHNSAFLWVLAKDCLAETESFVMFISLFSKHNINIKSRLLLFFEFSIAAILYSIGFKEILLTLWSRWGKVPLNNTGSHHFRTQRSYLLLCLLSNIVQNNIYLPLFLLCVIQQSMNSSEIIYIQFLSGTYKGYTISCVQWSVVV